MADSERVGQPAPMLTVQALVDGVLQDVPAEELRLTLANGMVVELFPDPRLDGVVLRLPVASDEEFHGVFLVRPGASNVLVIDAERRKTRRPTD